MHVAILIGHFPPGSFGGAEIQAEAWARRLADRHQITVITRRDPVTQPSREDRDGFRVVRLPVSPIPGWRTCADVLAIERAVRMLEPRPDLLLCFQTFLSGLAGVRLQRATGIPAVVWIRGEAEYRFAHSRVHRVVSPRVWREAAGVLVQSEENRVELLKALDQHAPVIASVVRAKLAVVPNGLDLPEGPFLPGNRILSVGRLIRDKGMDTVLEAAAGAGIPLTIAGDGPERMVLEARAGQLGLDARFEGYASRARLDLLYRQAACVVLAARRGEGLPNVLLEAMAHARAVVATPCAGTRDLLVDGVNGLLVPPDDAPALRAAMERLRREPGLSLRLGAEARRTAEGFRWDRVQPLLEDVIALRGRR
ncbi:MAG: glycosyltransferase family 4 protein [Candidatus Eisenbacteria bacterium]